MFVFEFVFEYVFVLVFVLMEYGLWMLWLSLSAVVMLALALLTLLPEFTLVVDPALALRLFLPSLGP